MPFGKIPETKQLISYLNINTITVRKKGSVGDGFLYGALGGAVLGGILDGVTGSPYGRGLGIFLVGILFLSIGGLIGAVVGGNKHTYKINKNKDNLQAMREKMWLKIYPSMKKNN
jgi:outer membrane lipoprotein SlyB